MAGVISKASFNTYKSCRVDLKVEADREDVLECATEIMEAIDVDGDGDITRVQSAKTSNLCHSLFFIFRMSL